MRRTTLLCPRAHENRAGHDDALAGEKPRQDGDPSVVALSQRDGSLLELRPAVRRLAILHEHNLPVARPNDGGPRHRERVRSFDLNREGHVHLGLQEVVRVRHRATQALRPRVLLERVTDEVDGAADRVGRAVLLLPAGAIVILRFPGP